jgi:PAS domain S-box-containing protein
MNQLEVIDKIRRLIDNLSRGNLDAEVDTNVEILKSYCAECQGLEKLLESINTLIDKHREAKTYLHFLSNGNLETEIPKGNQLIAPLKELHANLRHLVWQTQRIAAGDLNQHIDFMGDFSVSFNSLISKLKEKEFVEKCLENNEKRYRFINENINDVIWIIDLETMRYSYVSPSVFKFRGFTPEETMSQSVEQSLSAESHRKFLNILSEHMSQLINYEKNDPVITEIQQPCSDGSLKWIEVVAIFVLNENGEPYQILGVSRDIQKRKEVELQLEQYTKELRELNATKDKFFSIIAHDLRNPSSALLSLSELLTDNIRRGDNDRALQMAQLVQESSLNIFELLNNLLKWANLQRDTVTFTPEKFDLQSLIFKEMFNLKNVAEQKSISIDIQIAANQFALVDENMFRATIRNLVTNAIKFTPSGGKITISGKQEGKKLIVSVSDTGIGMNPDDMEKLFQFEKGFTRPGTNHEKGTGLGLILCKEFVQKHGGTIWVESKPGNGTTFFFDLPN